MNIALDGAGNAFAAWDAYDALTTTITNVQAAWLDGLSIEWGATQLVDEAGSGRVHDVSASMDDAGNVQVIWYDSSSGTMTRRYDATGGSGWNASTSALSNANTSIVKLSDGGAGLMCGVGMLYFEETTWCSVYTPY